jgi:catechol 2,3-dioxygenase-like lactoylglutathione lyase family enzyme
LADGPGFVLGCATDDHPDQQKGVNPMSVSVGVLDHFNIRTRNLADTVRFYEDVLGLEKGARPNFAFPGAWMYSEGKAVVHLVDISKTDELQKPDSGVVHHVAFISRGFAGMKKRLEAGKFEYDSRQVPGGDLWQIFVNDPNGVMIELNYEAAKEHAGTAPVERMDDVGAR